MASIITVKQTLPTYLKEFLRQDEQCILIHSKGSSKHLIGEFQEEWNFSLELQRSLSLNDTSIVSEVDLTGNPLTLDLDEGATLTFSSSSDSTSDIPPNWTVSEANHFPLNIEDARNLLNIKYNSKKSSIPVFCVTDAKDKLKTVIVGACNVGGAVTTYLGQIMGTFPCNDEELTVENLKKEHYDCVRVKADCTVYNFTRVYNIHGFAIQDIPALEYSKYNGCVFLETSWNIFSQEEPSINETGMKLILKVVSGHKESAIHSLWKELGHLQKYLNILSDTEQVNNCDTSISENYLSISDLMANIHQLSYSNLKRKRKMNDGVLDYNDLRDMSILDNFWTLLTRCQNLKDLKSSLTNFFMMVKLENYGSSNAVLTIRKCLESNTDYISQLTYEDSLKLLVYIGFEKLKVDYFTITNFYYPIHQGRLEQKWSGFQTQEDKKHVLGVVEYYGVNDTSFNAKKMKFLLQLHDAAEMLSFLKHNSGSSLKLSSDNFSLICKQIYEKILNESNDLKEASMKVKLVDIICDLNPRDNKIYEDKIPLHSIYDITSKVHNCTIKTVFHISQVPIFPKCIYGYNQTDDKSMLIEDEEIHRFRYKSKLIVAEKCL